MSNVRLCGGVVATTAVVLGLVNCGGGEHPTVTDTIGIPGDDAGSGNSADVTITPLVNGEVYFGNNGLVDCGSQADPIVLTLTNTSGRIVSYTATITGGADRFKVEPESGGVGAGGKGTLKITATPIPQISDVTTDLYAGLLEIQTKINVPPTSIKLHQTAHGAVLTTSAAADTVDFGQVKIGTPASLPFSLSNAGNADVTVNLTLGTKIFQYDDTSVATLKVSPNVPISKPITFAPDAVQPFSDTLALALGPGAVHCNVPPQSITMKGQGTASATVSPGQLNFGQVDCGTKAPYQTVTISSTLPMKFSPNLGKAATSPFTLADDTGAPIVPGSQIAIGAATMYTLRVVPTTVAIPASTVDNALGDTLTVTTDLTGDSPHAITLIETARGAVFGWTQPTVDVNGALGQSVNTNITLNNSGNAAAVFAIAVTDQPGFSSAPAGTFTWNTALATGTAPVGPLSGGNLITKLPTTPNTTYHGALAVTSTGVLCGDLPASVPLTTSTGDGSALTVAPAALNFGLVDCGKTYIDAITSAPYLTVDIASVTTTTFTPTLGKGPSTPYDLTDNVDTAGPATGHPLTQGVPVNIAAGQTYKLRIVPHQIPTRPATGVQDNAFGDLLTITSPDDTSPNVITLTQTARGVIFALNPTSVDFTPAMAYPSNIPFILQNTGNVTGTYTISIVGSAGIVSNIPTPSPGSAPVGATNGVLSATAAGTATLSVGSTSVLCGDLPNMPIILR